MLALTLLSGASCESCSKGGSGGGGGTSSGGSWLVGASALMLNVPHGALDEIGNYDLQVSDDLLGIACRGTREAWVVGGAGLLIATSDAGASWNVLDPGTTATLRGVALAAPNTVAIAGDGVARLSLDAGKHWRALPLPELPFTSVALRRTDGKVALFASETGTLHRWDAASGGVTEVARGTGALRSVVFSRDGTTAIAVGDGGQMLVSSDGGLTFAARSTGTAAGLKDVWLVGVDGGRFVAIGEGGLILEASTRGGEVAARSLGADVTLRALHLEASGHGMIVGDKGAAFLTEDAGRSWSRIDTGETRTIFGVDALDFGAEHL